MKKSPDGKKSSSRPEVRIRPLTALEDFEGCVLIQRGSGAIRTWT